MTFKPKQRGGGGQGKTVQSKTTKKSWGGGGQGKRFNQRRQKSRGEEEAGKTVQAKTTMKVVFNTYCQEKGGKTAECATVVQGVQAKTTVKS